VFRRYSIMHGDHALTADWHDGLWLAACLAMLMVCVWQDARNRRIPNRAVASGVIAALVLAGMTGGIGIGNALLGMTAGFFLLLPFYLMGVSGAGDVKLLAATGAFVGFPGVLVVTLVTFIAGGVMSLIWALHAGCARRMLVNLRNGLHIGLAHVMSGHLPRSSDFPVSAVRIPYAIAIAVGAMVQVVWSNRFGWMDTF